MDDPIVFLRMMYDKEEQEARDAIKKTTTSRRMIGGQMTTVATRPPAWRQSAWPPERVLAEIQSRRRTLVRCQEEMLSGIPRLVHFAKQTLWEMALPYADQPGYRPEWPS